MGRLPDLWLHFKDGENVVNKGWVWQRRGRVAPSDVCLTGQIKPLPLANRAFVLGALSLTTALCTQRTLNGKNEEYTGPRVFAVYRIYISWILIAMYLFCVCRDGFSQVK